MGQTGVEEVAVRSRLGIIPLKREPILVHAEPAFEPPPGCLLLYGNRLSCPPASAPFKRLE